MKRLSYILFIMLILTSAIGGSGCGNSYTVYGRVADELDQGIANVTISFSGGYSGTTITDADGNWSKADLKGIVLVTPSRAGWTFDPTSRLVTGASSSVNFVGNTFMKSWSFDFSNMTQEEMDRWFYNYGDYGYGYPGYYYSNDVGLVLHNIIFKCPINFTGDIIFRTFFYLNVTEAPVDTIATVLCDSDENSWVSLELYNMGNNPGELWKKWYLFEVAPDILKTWSYVEEDIPGLIWDGLNVIEMEKNGANITVRVNGEEVNRFEAKYYNWYEATNVYISGWLYFGFYEELSAPHGDLVFTRLEVDYSGDMTEI